MPNRVVHFEIQVEDMERAKKFYQDVFGWQYEKWMAEPPYWGIMTAPRDSKDLPAEGREPGINGGFVMRPTAAPALEQGTNAYVCTMQVEDFDQIAKKIEQAGGKVALPKFALAGMAWQGYFIDTEGNTFGVHQPDKNAK